MSASRSSRYIQRLKEAGYKITAARLAVLQVIENQLGHLNPAQVLAEAKAVNPKIGRATVYRALELFTTLGIVRPISSSNGAPLYILAEGGHHHLVCNSCHIMIDFDECVAEPLLQQLAEQNGFQVQSHLLEIYGLCAACYEQSLIHVRFNTSRE